MRRYALTIMVIVVLVLSAFNYLLPAAVLALTTILYYLLRWLLSEMAKQNVLFTLRTEGEIKAIMKGNICVRYIMRVANHIIDPDDFDIVKYPLEKLDGYAQELAREAVKLRKDPAFVERKLEENPATNTSLPKFKKDFEQRLRKANSATLFEQLFGVVWVGLPPYRVFTYEFRWIKYGQEKRVPGGAPSAIVGMIPRDEEVSSLFWRYTSYGLVVEDAETGAGQFAKKSQLPERIELRLELVIETVTTNPQKTLFRTAGLSSAGEWLGAVSKLIRDAIRRWVGTVDYDHLVSNETEVNKALEDIRTELNSGQISGGPETVSTIKDYGQEVLRINLVNVSLKNVDLQKSIQAIFQAEQGLRAAKKDADANVQKARGQKALAAALLLGEAQGLDAIVKAGPDAVRMNIARNIGSGGIKVLQVGAGQSGNMLTLPESLLGEENNPNSPSTP